MKNFKQGYKQQTLDKYSVSQSFFDHINKKLKEHHSPIPLLEQKFMFPESFEVRPLNRSNCSKSVKIYNLDIKTPLIQAEFKENKLPSKLRRSSLPSRFSFDVKKSEFFYKPDTRTEFEIFKDILDKLHHRYSIEDYTELCRLCNHDLAIPEITPKGNFLGQQFIKESIKLYKSKKNFDIWPK